MISVGREWGTGPHRLAQAGVTFDPSCPREWPESRGPNTPSNQGRIGSDRIINELLYSLLKSDTHVMIMNPLGKGSIMHMTKVGSNVLLQGGQGSCPHRLGGVV